jgi:hypothetical protein
MYSNLLHDPKKIIYIYIYIYTYKILYVAFNFFSPPKRVPTSRQSTSPLDIFIALCVLVMISKR